MEDTPAPGETAPTEPLQPQVPAPAPARDNDVPAAVAEALKKIEMERNMLRKKLDAKEKEEQERQQKELEEKEDYRALAEREKARADALEKERQERETAESRATTTKAVFDEYDQKVVDVAKLTGISASDDSDEAKAALKAKLDEIQKTLGITDKTQTPRPTNPVEYQDVDDNGGFIARPQGHLDIDTAARRLATNGARSSDAMKNLTAKIRSDLGLQQHPQS